MVRSLYLVSLGALAGLATASGVAAGPPVGEGDLLARVESPGTAEPNAPVPDGVQALLGQAVQATAVSAGPARFRREHAFGGIAEGIGTVFHFDGVALTRRNTGWNKDIRGTTVSLDVVLDPASGALLFAATAPRGVGWILPFDGENGDAQEYLFENHWRLRPAGAADLQSSISEVLEVFWGQYVVHPHSVGQIVATPVVGRRELPIEPPGKDSLWWVVEARGVQRNVQGERYWSNLVALLRDGDLSECDGYLLP